MDWLFDTTPFVLRSQRSDWFTWLNILSNIGICITYYAIFITIMICWYKRKLNFIKSNITFMFALFMFSCGTIHILDALLFYFPMYRLLTLADLIAAIVSLIILFYLPDVVSYLLQMKMPDQLEWINDQLEQEIESKKELMENVRKQNHDLANQVQRLQVVIATQGWIAEKQMDLKAMKEIISNLRKEYNNGGANKTNT